MKNYPLSSLLAVAVLATAACDSNSATTATKPTSANLPAANAPARVAVTDRQIEDTAKASYNYRTVLDNKITVKADKGVVTLTGKVDDRDHRTLAADTVADMPGVVRVNNEIEVTDTHKEYSDGWIAMKIRGVLLTKAHVSAMDSQVQVNNGNVILTGKADNQAQKDLTEVYAKEIRGVKTVKNQITIVAPVVVDKAGATAGDKRSDDSRTWGDRIDDSSITAQVKGALLGHSSTSALKTKVTTRDGVVAVSGVAASEAEITLVTKLVEGIRGVKSVKNAMTVETVVAKS
jgi:hyperosmotically inducible periplasmic protein